MTTRRSRPPRSRKSRNPEPLPNEIPIVIPPPARTLDEAALQPGPDTPEGELAAIEAGWDELLA